MEGSGLNGSSSSITSPLKKSARRLAFSSRGAEVGVELGAEEGVEVVPGEALLRGAEVVLAAALLRRAVVFREAEGAASAASVGGAGVAGVA
jgi:hypothetical protein